jgi:hypothetical protein
MKRLSVSTGRGSCDGSYPVEALLGVDTKRALTLVGWPLHNTSSAVGVLG